MNPYVRETRYAHRLDEEGYDNGAWHDVGLWVEVGGTALVICTISINANTHANVGFRLIDENNKPLLPYRTSTNTRKVTHFSMEPYTRSTEDLTPVTFHMLANCKYAKSQVTSDDGKFGINRIARRPVNAVWSHKPISTISVLPLVPNYQGGANTVFHYPQSRTPPDDKDKIKPSSSSGGPPQ